MQKFSFVLIIMAFVSFGTLPSLAQETAEPKEPKEATAPKVQPCPKLAVKTPTQQHIREGSPVTFVAEIAGGDPNVTPTILWSVSAGMINSGQGERRIEVDSTGAGIYRQIAADVWVGGYAPECSNTASVTVRVAGTPTLLDQFAELPADQENQRIAAAASALAQSNDRLYVFAYAGRTSERNFANTALRRILGEFGKLGVPAARVRVYDGGFREQPTFEFWIVPDGAEAPRPTPTVDRREIVYPRTPAPARRTTPPARRRP